jgi:hypothetical protein
LRGSAAQKPSALSFLLISDLTTHFHRKDSRSNFSCSSYQKSSQEECMYVSIRRAKTQDYASDEIVRRASEDLLPQIRTLAGFVSYDIVMLEDEALMTISAFDSKAAAEVSNQLFINWAKGFDLTSLIQGTPELLVGEVVFHQSK